MYSFIEKTYRQFPKEEQSPDVKSLLEEKHVLEETLKHIGKLKTLSKELISVKNSRRKHIRTFGN